MSVTSPYPFIVVAVVPLSALCGHYQWCLPFLGHYFSVFVYFGLIPILDLVCGRDDVNPTKEEEKELKDDIRYRVITYLWAPIQLATVIWCCYIAANEIDSLSEFIGLGLSVGFVGAASINIGHELQHKIGSKVEMFLSKVIFTSVCYGHFFLEHTWGHHKNVATPRDPSTALFGETFYQFYPRTVVGTWHGALAIENRRMAKETYSSVGRILHNYVYQCTAVSLSMAAIVGWLWGIQATMMFFFQAWVAFSLLEVVNYLEHYGLRRKEISPGVYEPVNITHSWNAPERITNYFLFKLQRHSDHHANALRRYQILRTFPESPSLPTGYAGMALLALVPPLWFRVMNPRVLAYNAKQGTQATVS
eukprot:Rmarinus@m.26756